MIWILPHYSMMYPRVLFSFILYTQFLYEITDYRSAVHHMFVDDLYKVCWLFWYQLSQLKVMIWILPPYSILVRIWHQPSQLRVMIWIQLYGVLQGSVLFCTVHTVSIWNNRLLLCSTSHILLIILISIVRSFLCNLVLVTWMNGLYIDVNSMKTRSKHIKGSKEGYLLGQNTCEFSG